MEAISFIDALRKKESKNKVFRVIKNNKEQIDRTIDIKWT